MYTLLLMHSLLFYAAAHYSLIAADVGMQLSM